MTGIDAIMRAAPVIPVLVLDGSHDPAALAHALVHAGLPVIEITLRTDSALDAIAAMARVPGAIVGAGTVLDGEQAKAARDAGSQFLVSPGLTEPVAGAARALDVPLLPGVATAGDIMRGLDLGFDRFKFFPAEAAGGLSALKALAGPFGNVRFCPTGGIRRETAAEWLALDAVLCVGGTWIVPKGASLDEVGRLAADAASLGSR
ncbi:bifunctional 4-hydroxy-2-oxoglutarate aldolase/2-dehydro-3-deoxy-phosphogluconate aldolase [Sphingomonas sabuli]|uniref:2-dehydro-3-deoxy-phosphogluconate aldolase n=1 Tax=Sphingomonas sabuli TaxID=2764186 RepID=A0A7G9KZA1_9SPHN|nr:bifunctional 4-hydroxy-2-oxoglutarate aldolase/2-dehydro-3-deoxy-phosphogluconate aldolase [Sphingomonas sabuli]QNM81700.1 bifunctional 4-hydroxy-2-oxoglutarate aldolase/2-dehydro-3-deoxy-phosphogluconate aldolase [Sphingomonas sabuli]